MSSFPSRSVAVVLLLLAAFAFPARAISATVSTAAPTPAPGRRVTYTYKTFLDQGAYDYWTIPEFDVDFGTVTLTFNPDGTITGRYHPDNDVPTAVRGRLVGGGKLWLQIGQRRFTGRFTRRGFAAATASSSAGWTLFGELVRPEHSAG
jgi:hypothetical protein